MKKIFLLLCLSSIVGSYCQAQDIFLLPTSSTQTFTGESQDINHLNWVNATAYTGGVTAAYSPTGNQPISKPNFEDLSFTVCVDKATNDFRKFMYQGKPLDALTVDFCYINGGTTVNGKKPNLTIKLQGAFITSMKEGATTSDGKITMNISFAYEKISYLYYAVTSSGLSTTPTNIFNYDVKAARVF